LSSVPGQRSEYHAQLATLVDAAPEGDEWLHELKYDGYRIGCFVERGGVRLVSRRGNDWTTSFPEVCEAMAELRAQTALLDGEVAIRGRTFGAVASGSVAASGAASGRCE
jgi:ATP-dependent DNA ligase